ncbi:MAG TPA: hypothetical protein VF857_03970, partial [Spirochaetota bacterium]
SLAGSVSDVTKTPRIDIRMVQSEIVLTDLYPYYRAITNDDSMRFSGKVSLFPLTIKGTPDVVAVNGGVSFSSVALKMPGLDLSLPSLNLGYALNKTGSRGKIGVTLALSNFTYKLDRSSSGVNTLNLSADIDTANDFGHFGINRIDLQFFDPRGNEKALTLGIKGDINVKPSVSGDVSITELTFKKGALMTMLPDSIADGMQGLPLNNPVRATLGAHFALGDPTRAKVTLALKVPDFDLNDLLVNCEVGQSASRSRIDIPKFSIESRSRGLAIGAKGFIETKRSPLSDSDLSLNLSLSYPTMTPVYGPWNLSGAVGFKASMKGDLVKGKVKGAVTINDLSVKNKETMLDVEGVNLDFPFAYDFGYRPSGESRLAVDKKSLFESPLFKDKENLSIKSIASKHPARDQQFVYLRDLKGTLFFRDNSFEIQELRATVLDGTLYGKDIFFYLSDLNKENMEYKVALDVTNVDVSLLDNPNPKKKSHNAELSLNVNIAGSNLDFSKGMNINGSINIFKIGENFANKLMKGLSQEKGKSKLGIAQPIVDNLEIPQAFYYYLDNGIMYADVSFKSKAIGYVIGIKNDRVKFDRIPIQEYLRKVQE